MSETARALGLPGTVEWRGEKLTVSRITFEVEAFFERWLEDNLTAALERSRAAGSRDLFLERVREANLQLAARDFAWTGPAAEAAAFNGPGAAELAWLCITRHHHDWTRERHAELMSDPEARRRVLEAVWGVSAPAKNGHPPVGQPTGGNS
jgi:hypothetical protein